MMTINSNSKDGIYRLGDYNNVTNNTIHSNSQYAINIDFRGADNNRFTNNNLGNCSTGGSFACIRILDSDYNIFDGNLINDSSNIGILIRSTNDGIPAGSGHNVFKNTNMTNIAGTSVSMTGTWDGSNNTFLNFSYNND